MQTKEGTTTPDGGDSRTTAATNTNDNGKHGLFGFLSRTKGKKDPEGQAYADIIGGGFQMVHTPDRPRRDIRPEEVPSDEQCARTFRSWKVEVEEMEQKQRQNRGVDNQLELLPPRNFGYQQQHKREPSSLSGTSTGTGRQQRDSATFPLPPSCLSDEDDNNKRSNGNWNGSDNGMESKGSGKGGTSGSLHPDDSKLRRPEHHRREASSESEVSFSYDGEVCEAKVVDRKQLIKMEIYKRGCCPYCRKPHSNKMHTGEDRDGDLLGCAHCGRDLREFRMTPQEVGRQQQQPRTQQRGNDGRKVAAQAPAPVLPVPVSTQGTQGQGGRSGRTSAASSREKDLPPRPGSSSSSSHGQQQRPGSSRSMREGEKPPPPLRERAIHPAYAQPRHDDSTTQAEQQHQRQNSSTRHDAGCQPRPSGTQETEIASPSQPSSSNAQQQQQHQHRPEPAETLKPTVYRVFPKTRQQPQQAPHPRQIIAAMAKARPVPAREKQRNEELRDLPSAATAAVPSRKVYASSSSPSSSACSSSETLAPFSSSSSAFSSTSSLPCSSSSRGGAPVIPPPSLDPFSSSSSPSSLSSQQQPPRRASPPSARPEDAHAQPRQTTTDPRRTGSERWSEQPNGKGNETAPEGLPTSQYHYHDWMTPQQKQDFERMERENGNFSDVLMDIYNEYDYDDPKSLPPRRDYLWRPF